MIFELEKLAEVALKLGLALVCGGLLGIERGRKKRPAGFRTYMLVCIGATLVMMTNDYISTMYQTGDPSRMGAQVISGIGFLGAGTILREGFSVKGLTTAASLWAVSCIGIAVGSGFIVGGLVATFVIYLTLNSLKRFIVRGSAGKLLFIEIKDTTVISRLIEGDFVKYNHILPKGFEGSKETFLKSFLGGVKGRRPLRSPHQSPTTIVPAPSLVSSSMRMEWGVRPSMITTVLTPWEIASMQQSTLGIMPPEMTPSA